MLPLVLAVRKGENWLNWTIDKLKTKHFNLITFGWSTNERGEEKKIIHTHNENYKNNPQLHKTFQAIFFPFIYCTFDCDLFSFIHEFELQAENMSI